MPSSFEIGGEPLDIEALPQREATEQERRKMLGSLATIYELKCPLLYCVDTGKFYPIDNQDLKIEFNSGRELVILQTNVILPSIFRKVKKRRISKIWR
jgi:septum formation topological specificity factor MinE